MDELTTARRCADVMWEKDRASQALGIRIEIPAAGEAIATMVVRESMLNGVDVCHGGLVFTLADTAFAFACNAYNRESVAASVSIDFIRPAHLHDELVAIATEDHRGRKNGYYTITVRNQRAEMVAIVRGRSAGTGKAMLPVESDT